MDVINALVVIGPKKFKKNIVDNDLHKSKVIGSNFENELKEIRKKYNYMDYPRSFVESVIKNFKAKQISTEKLKLMKILNHSFPSD